jgi:hypothetical protein
MSAGGLVGTNRGLFRCERFRFILYLSGPNVFPPYKGAMFRGAFGNALKRVMCVRWGAKCADCLLRSQCIYLATFEPTPPAGFEDAGRFGNAPAPYVIDPPLSRRREYRAGEALGFDLVLIGRAVDLFPYFLYAFVELGRKGLGPRRGRFRVDRVDLLRAGGDTCVYDGGAERLYALPPAPPPQAPHGGDAGECERLRLEFLTPLRLKEKGKLVTRLTFPLLFERLAQRLALLSAFYGEDGGTPPDFSELLEPAESVQVEADHLHWFDWKRYSSRQKSEMNFGGLVGLIDFRGPLTPFLPWLRLAEQINVGQSTTFGLGRVLLKPPQ